ncbi:hypothetical protein B0A54_15180 [Friedmanniomyces endolithicus]|uniref:Uncharacterized protein n=1 Tax=Friedmanniomyces endolithicus TaxID=329885 RepID=A0A4U0U8N5_9PEZI|nr:hypothetical protein B0A54_15180 [Friedmanniomyces endolithicus]
MNMSTGNDGGLFKDMVVKRCWACRISSANNVSADIPSAATIHDSLWRYPSLEQTPPQIDKSAKTWLDSWRSWGDHGPNILKRWSYPQSRDELAALKAERKVERIAARKATRDAAEKAKRYSAGRKAERVAAEMAKKDAARKSGNTALPEPEMRKQKIREWYGHQYDYAPGRREWFGSQYDYE